MLLLNLETLIRNSIECKFRCSPAGKTEGEFIASTTSILSPNSNAENIDLFQEKLGTQAQNFLEFYKKYDSAIFFQDTISDTAALHIHPINSWDILTKEMKQWYEILDEDELDDSEFDWLETGVAFAEVPCSGNYFVLACEGKLTGKIIYSDHDELYPEVYANSFIDFLVKFLSAPIKEIEHLGCYIRYNDGRTDLQWIPIEIA